MKVPFFDLKRQYNNIKNEVDPAVQEVLNACAYAGGPFVEEFESNFASYCDVRGCAGVNSGTSALFLALIAAGVEEGDEVIIPANTFIATAWAPAYLKAKPVFVDCTSDTWNIDPQEIEANITPKTKAIIGVHLYGQPFNLQAVKKIADQYGLILIEDAAQAQGATYEGQKAGSLAEMGCFSFYPGKNLGAYGEAGAVTSNNTAYIDHIQRLKNHGSVNKYYHEEVGYNMRMEGIQGAVLNIKLNYLEKWNDRRREIVKLYKENLSSDEITFQAEEPNAASSCHLCVVTTDNREKLMRHLHDNEVGAALHYPVPCHLQKAFVDLGYKEGDFPNAEYLSSHCLSLPLFPEMTDAEVEAVINTLNKY